MPKVAQRLLIFFIGIPVVIAIILPTFYNHIFFQLLLLLFTFIATLELCNIFSNENVKLSKPLTVILNLSLVLTAYICGLFKLPFDFINAILVIDLLIIFCSEIFFAKDDFKNSNARIARSMFTVIYAGLLPTYISRLAILSNATKLICLFVMLVFISDSAAWLFGMLFGKNNRGIIKASPKKSIAGFIGAYLASIVLSLLFFIFILNADFNHSTIIKSLIFAICVTTSSIIGDLAESVLKRSAGVKDSGNIILGRGGVLDSIDSILLAAPFFYILAKYLF